MEVNLIINNTEFTYSAKKNEMLVDTLRKLGYKSVKRGCDKTSCGVCNISLDEKLIPSCSYLTIRANGKRILTVEGIQEEARVIGKYITEEGVEQCGFCSPGHVIAIYCMKNDLLNPTMDEVKHYLAGNMCRCSGFEGQHRAIAKYLEVR